MTAPGSLLDSWFTGAMGPVVSDAQGVFDRDDWLWRSRLLARSLNSPGAGTEQTKQPVAFLTTSDRDWLVALTACWLAGRVAVPLCVGHPVPELEYVLRDCGARTVMASPSLAERARAAAAATGGLVFELGHERADQRVNSGAVFGASLSGVKADPSAGALIVYTSGTTGGPKGALHTHGSLLAQVTTLCTAWGWSTADRTLNVLPLHHVHGIVNVVLCALASGAGLELSSGLVVERVWERFASGELSVFMAVPTVYAKLLGCWQEADAATREHWSRGARGLRLMVSGSAALPLSLLDRWEEVTGHRLLERYGMTETGMILSNPLVGERVPGSVGSPLPGVEVRFAEGGELDTEGRWMGALEVRGPQLFREYWGKTEATAEAFTADGWFRTGDVATIDALDRSPDPDNPYRGRYRLLGRSSVDILKTGGYKVSALEVEEILREHPRVRDCAVVGVADEVWGQRLAVAIVPESFTDEVPLELGQLREWAKERLAPYKVPSLMQLLEELPRNALGKVTKAEVARLFQES